MKFRNGLIFRTGARFKVKNCSAIIQLKEPYSEIRRRRRYKRWDCIVFHMEGTLKGEVMYTNLVFYENQMERIPKNYENLDLNL